MVPTMRRLLILATLPLLAALPLSAASASGATSSADAPGHVATVPSGETTGNQIFNDSMRPAQPGVAPGAPVQPLYQSLQENSASQPRMESTATAGSTQVLGFVQVGEVTSGDWRSDLHFNLLSTIAYDSLDINVNGAVIKDAGYTAWWSGQMTSLMNTAHAAGDKVVLTITDFSSSSIETLVTTPSYAQRAVSQVVQQVAQRGADGVNVDFEGGSGISASAFTAFIAQLRSALKSQVPHQSYLTLDTYASSYKGGSYFNIRALSPYVDGFDVMAYDLNYGRTLPNAPLYPNSAYSYTDTQIVNGYLGLVPAWQIILGVPYYGYVYSTTSKVFNATRGGDDEVGAVTYSGALADFACTAGPPDNLVHNWAPSAASPWAAWWSPASGDPCGGNHDSYRELYYDNGQSLGDKYGLVKSDELQGIGIWALGYDSGSNDLWNAISANLSVGHGDPVLGAAPRITGLSPGVGPAGGGNTVTVQGQSFEPGLALTFNGQSLPIANLTPFSFTFTPPAGSGTVSLGVSDTWGTSAAAYTYVDPSRYVSLTPFRILDTRSSSCVNCSGGALGPHTSRTVTIAGYHDPSTGQSLPSSGVQAVVLNLTAVGGTSGTYLAVFPAGATGTSTSTVNARRGEVIANLAIAPLGSGGAIDVYNAAGTVNVVADVLGYFTSSSGGAGLYHPLSAAVRVCDTRGGTACSTGGPLVAGHPRLLRVVDGATTVTTGGDAAAVTFNLTAVAPSRGTYLAVYPPSPSTHTCGTPPVISNLNLAGGAVQANRVIARIDPTNGSVCVATGAGSVNVILDINGWFGNGADSGGALFHPLGPSRICDTRPPGAAFSPPPCAGETLSGGETLAVQVGGMGGLPSSGIRALAANLTAVDATAGTYLTVGAWGVADPTSDLNVGPGEVIANCVMTPVSSDQRIGIYNSRGGIDAIVDTEGWFG